MIYKKLAILTATALVVIGATAIVPTFAQQLSNQVATTIQSTTDAAKVYDIVSPSVVAINVFMSSSTDTTFNNPLDPNQVPNVPPQNGITQASGSGFVLDTDGHIVTNAHVVQGANRIEVNFLDGTMVEAELVGIDTDSDIAVLKVDLPAEKLQPVTFTDSDTLDIGQSVYAIGSPFGQRWTLTEGIVSALDRAITGLNQFSIGGVIQTDAAINPGNSGGPLLDATGGVIGMNSQILSESGSSAGIGYAIPANLVKHVSEELINTGFISYAYLGIQGTNVDLALIQTLNLANDFKGVVVEAIAQGGPAARAGIQDASDFTEVDGLQIPKTVDIITAINGVPMDSMPTLVEYIATQSKPGDKVTISILRNGTETLELTATLTPRPTQ